MEALGKVTVLQSQVGVLDATLVSSGAQIKEVELKPQSKVAELVMAVESLLSVERRS